MASGYTRRLMPRGEHGPSAQPGRGDLVPHPSVVSRRVNDEIVLVHLDTNRIYSLNATAAEFWELLVSGSDRAEAEAQLAATFDVEPAELAREVDSCIKQLLDERLVQAQHDD
jgi:hypothetical protein